MTNHPNRRVNPGNEPLPITLMPPPPSRESLTPQTTPTKDSRTNAATGASAAGMRALSAQAIAFYFRAPAKAFFRMRVDYLAYARAIHEAQTKALAKAFVEGGSASFLATLRHQIHLWLRGTTPGVLTSAVRHQGWGVIPRQVLPPLLANISVSAVLYTSYLHILGELHEESKRATKRVYPPPEIQQTFAAGFVAGAVQSIIAAPLDAIQTRYDHREVVSRADTQRGRPQNLWAFGAEKIREIGFRGVFSGWSLSFLKDSFGNAFFFGTFEWVKAQGYYCFVRWYYRGLNDSIIDDLAVKRPYFNTGGQSVNDYQDNSGIRIIRPHYAIEPTFLLLAGICASLAQQIIIHPLTHIQIEHWDHLEDVDAKVASMRARAAVAQNGSQVTLVAKTPPSSLLRTYIHAYRETYAQCVRLASQQGQSLGAWLYRGFWWNAVRQMPSTSAGLVIFELVRRKYGLNSEEVRISQEDYDIVL